jgi:DNA-binding transcriptional LysR family regulator
MDRLESMAIALAISQAGSLSAAARELRKPLPTVSRKVSELEAHLKARLFIRSTRRLTLTDAGVEYIAACKRIMEEVAEAERSVAGEFAAPQGELVISAPVVFGRVHVLPVVTAFLREFPHIDIRLVLSDRLLNLGEDHVDATIRIGTLADSRLVATRIGATRRIVCATPRYLREHGAPRTPADIATHACIAFEGIGGGDTWKFAEGSRELPVTIRPRLLVNTAEAAIDAALANLGLTRVLSYQVERAMRDAKLEAVLERFAPPAIPIHLLYGPQKRLPLKLRTFLDFASARLRARLRGQTPS